MSFLCVKFSDSLRAIKQMCDKYGISIMVRNSKLYLPFLKKELSECFLLFPNSSGISDSDFSFLLTSKGYENSIITELPTGLKNIKNNIGGIKTSCQHFFYCTDNCYTKPKHVDKSLYIPDTDIILPQYPKYSKEKVQLTTLIMFSIAKLDDISGSSKAAIRKYLKSITDEVYLLKKINEAIEECLKEGLIFQKRQSYKLPSIAKRKRNDNFYNWKYMIFLQLHL